MRPSLGLGGNYLVHAWANATAWLQVHLTSCVYWVVKEVCPSPIAIGVSTDWRGSLCSLPPVTVCVAPKKMSTSEEEVEAFLNYHVPGLGDGGSQEVAPRYVLSTYFISSVFTTVGFGDIHAENTAEARPAATIIVPALAQPGRATPHPGRLPRGPQMVLCVIIMYMGTFIFGSLLSEVRRLTGRLRPLSSTSGILQAGQARSFVRHFGDRVGRSGGDLSGVSAAQPAPEEPDQAAGQAHPARAAPPPRAPPTATDARAVALRAGSRLPGTRGSSPLFPRPHCPVGARPTPPPRTSLRARGARLRRVRGRLSSTTCRRTGRQCR